MDDAYGACKNKRPGHSSVQVDPEVVAKLDEVRKMKGVTPRAVSDEDRSGGPDRQICKGFSRFTLPPRDQIVTAEGDLREAVLLHDQRRLQDP